MASYIQFNCIFQNQGCVERLKNGGKSLAKIDTLLKMLVSFINMEKIVTRSISVQQFVPVFIQRH